MIIYRNRSKNGKNGRLVARPVTPKVARKAKNPTKSNKQKVEVLMESLLLVEEFKRFFQNFFYRMIQANFVLARVWREASRP